MRGSGRVRRWRSALVLCAVATLCAGVAREAFGCGPVTPLSHVERRGDGPVRVVLIPGWLCDWTVWRPFMSLNEEAYTMFAVTLPGAVGSPAPPLPDPRDPRATPWLDNAVLAVSALIEQEAGGRAVVVGHSMGGVIALRLALERPDLVERVVSVDGFPAFPLRERLAGPERLEYVSEVIEPSMRSMTRQDWLDRQTFSSAALVRDERTRAALLDMFLSNNQNAGAQYVIEYLKTDLRARLGQIEPPALFIAAVEEDEGAFKVAPDALRAEWKEQVGAARNAELVFFENTRHFIVAERPRAVSRAVAQFIAGEPVDGVPLGAPLEPPAAPTPAPAPLPNPPAPPPGDQP